MIKIKDLVVLFKNILLSRLDGYPYKLNFMVTSSCNSRCITCNIWKKFKSNPLIVKNELSYEEIKKIFINLPKTITWLSLTGGEVFLRKDIDLIILAAIKHMPNLKLISIPSNGLAKDRILGVIEKITKSKHPQIVLNFSIDGPEEVHDYIRGIKGGFKKTWSTYVEVRKLVKNDPLFEVGIETTVSSKNVSELYHFLNQLIEKNHKLTITIAHGVYLNKNESNNESLSPKNNIKQVKQLIKLFKSNLSLFSPRAFIERQYLSNVLAYLLNPSKKVIECEALKSSFFLYSSGDVTPCLMWGNKLINMRTNGYDIKNEWRSERFNRVRKEIKDNRCPNCWTPCEAYQSILWSTITFKYFPK